MNFAKQTNEKRKTKKKKKIGENYPQNFLHESDISVMLCIFRAIVWIRGIFIGVPVPRMYLLYIPASM